MKKILLIALTLTMILVLSSCTAPNNVCVTPNPTEEVSQGITQVVSQGVTQGVGSGTTYNPNPTVERYHGDDDVPDGELKKAKRALEESAVTLKDFYLTQNIEERLYDKVGELLDGINVNYGVSIGDGTDFLSIC